MRANRPSFTAAFVAACRGLDGLLPPEQRLLHDPYGTRFAGLGTPLLERAIARAPGVFEALRPALRPLTDNVLWMQLRTRALDDFVRAFVSAGGRQLVLLGAGFDARAARLSNELGDAWVYEVDHPATQARKRAVVGDAAPNARYVSWDFERDSLQALPARLAAEGHDASRPTLTIWEGVTMYLTPEAIEASVSAVRAYSAPGSHFGITYFDRSRLDQPTLRTRLSARAVALAGEPFRFGWRADEFADWMAARGFRVVSDRSDVVLARELLGSHGEGAPDEKRHVALAVR